MVDLAFDPDFVVHPGETLAETLDVLGMSQVDLALRAELSEKHISNIIHGKASITPETAIKLERVLGVKAYVWNNLEQNYQMMRARLEAQEALKQEISSAKKFTCYPELVALGVVAPVAPKNVLEKIENLLKYFRVDSLLLIPEVESVAFRNMKGKVNQESLAAWLRYGEIEAEKIIVDEFSSSKLRKVLVEIKKLISLHEDFSNALQKLLASCGVAVVYAPYFKNTMINGATRWIGDKAVIQLNTKGTYADIFWFTLFHEIGHLLLHGKKDQFLEFPKNGEKKDEKEQEADEFAVEQLFPQESYDKFLREGISAIAAMGVNIDRGILAGRLAHEGKITWAQANRLRDRLIFVPDEK